MERITREEIHMKTAILWSMRSLCKRPSRKIGAVITNLEMDKVLAVGYNGPARQLGNDACRDVIGDCGCLHAEMNAIAKDNSNEPDKIMFVTMSPCGMCASLIAQCGFYRVVYLEEYRNTKGLDILRDCGTMITKMHKEDFYDKD